MIREHLCHSECGIITSNRKKPNPKKRPFSRENQIAKSPFGRISIAVVLINMVIAAHRDYGWFLRNPRRISNFTI